MSLADYENLDTLQASLNSEVSRGARKSDDFRVIIKQSVAADEKSATRLRFEHRVLQRLQGIDGIPALVDFIDGDSVAIVVADVGAQSLRELVKKGPLPLEDVVHIAIQVSTTLGLVHRARVSHKDINPQNIIFNPKTRAVQLIDFGIASFLSSEMQLATALVAIEGTVNYVSPEQTGRLNKMLDYRTDFYSLGVTLYELITGKLPFSEQALPALVHSILARSAEPVRHVNAKCPAALSDVIDTMMAKEASDRYQSAYGLQRDFETCQQALAAHKEIPGFVCKQHDRIEHFRPVQGLFGRKDALDLLTKAYDAAAAGTRQLLMVRGPSGIGKSALVNELQARVLDRNGILIAGKYDQLRRHTPFSAFSQAVASLVRRIMLEEAETIEAWREKVLASLQGVGQVLVDVVPSIKQLIGEQPPVSELSLQESETRLSAALDRFVHMLCAEVPLVLFLDDLQWADAGTLKLIQTICTASEPVAGLLIIGAYRDNEVPAESPLLHMLEQLEKKQFEVGYVTVSPLALTDVEHMVMQSTGTSQAVAANLASVVQAKTAGNPFFIHELFKHLAEQGILKYDPKLACWNWDIAAVLELNITDNVVEFMARKLRAMPLEQQKIASLAACIGADFEASLLAGAAGGSFADIARELGGMLESGAIVPLARSYRYLADSKTSQDEVRYRFSHDKVQQAAFELLSSAEAATAHYKIGKHIRQQRAGEPISTWIFEIIGHMNAAKELLSEPELVLLAQYSLVAAVESSRSLAYGIAINHSEGGLAMLGDQAWSEHYALSRSLVLEAASAELSLGRVESASKRLDGLLSRSKTPMEKAEIQRRRSEAFLSLTRWQESIDAAFDGIKTLGFKVNRHPTMLVIVPKLLQLRAKINKKSSEQLLNAPAITDERLNMFLGLMTTYNFAAFNADPLLWSYTTLRIVELTLTSGNSRASAYGYSSLAPIVISIGDYELGKKATDLAMALVANFPSTTAPAFCAMCTVVFTEHSRHTPAGVQDLFTDAIQVATNNGDPINGGIAAAIGLMCAAQYSLPRGEAFAARYTNYVKSAGSLYTWCNLAQVKQFVACLQGKTENRFSFDDADFKEAVEFAVSASPGIDVTLLAFKAAALFVHGDTSKAIEHLTQMLAMKKAFESIDDCHIAFIVFTTCAVLTSDALDAKGPVKHWRTVKAYLKKCDKWATLGTIYSGYPVFIRAQLAALAGKDEEALLLYDRATALLEQHGYAYAAAVAYERAALFCIERNIPTAAAFYSERAVAKYESWGAPIKAQQLRERWGIRADVQLAGVTMMSSATQTITSGASTAIDLPAFMAVAQSLSSEVVLDKLVVRIMGSMKELSGADRGVLLLKQIDKLVVVADTATPGANPVEMSRAAENLPARVLSFAQSSGNTVLMNDAASEEAMARDPYIAQHRPKSVMCVPIFHQGKMLGIIYLENRLLSNAFTPERALSVSMLATQAAISLDHAFVRGHLEQTVEERTKQLKEANEKLVKVERARTELQMAGGFAHEIRNALLSARFTAEYILTADDGAPSDEITKGLASLVNKIDAHSSEEDAAAMHEDVQSLRESSENLMALIKEIYIGLVRAVTVTGEALEYAQTGVVFAEAGASAAVGDVLAKLLEEFDENFAAENISTQIDVPNDLRVEVSERHLHVILRNLLANARDAMSERPERKLVVKAESRKGEIVMTVQDTGSGIPHDVQQRLYEPFFSTKGVNGTGLGLGISKKLVELYRGTIAYETQEEVGTSFHVMLPKTTPPAPR